MPSGLLPGNPPHAVLQPRLQHRHEALVIALVIANFSFLVKDSYLGSFFLLWLWLVVYYQEISFYLQFLLSQDSFVCPWVICF